MKISEIFYSIQGEGMYTGIPSIFIRTFGCNYKCIFCDSAHAIKKLDVPILDLIPQEIFNVIQEWHNCNHVVITGGEPLIQKEELKELMHLLYRYNITIETNGSIFDDTIKPNLWSISPKTKNSIIDKDKKLNQAELNVSKVLFEKNNTYEHLKKFLSSGIPCQFKFVVFDEKDLKEIQKISYDSGIPKPMIYLMPEGRTVSDQQVKSLALVDICKEHGYNFCTRLHIWLWGDKRGV
jgi:7-carboxy-7-deazaguanine synthase